ncbi:peroxiredoxin [Nitratireductor sp. XY-223]|uniref:peroxiredoxin n=1 Tax=Nitratireductor sp. XY-223 TaxID=2561926 RepID=UPI0010AA5A3F|nr:peroxiredoxin [Nitratireductor sp. XY-223]
MSLRIGSSAPDFVAETTIGRIRFHDWIGQNWCVFFSHPKDFTPVCTTELGSMAKLKGDFERRGCKVIGLGIDPVSSHLAWSADIEEIAGAAPDYPIIGDGDLAVSKLYGMLPADEPVGNGPRTAHQNATVRTVFIIDPSKTVRLIIAYPMTCGRNFTEVLRALDSLQLNERHSLATPADWSRGEDVLLPFDWTDEEARAAYPEGWRAPKPYLRFVPQPR